VGRRQRNGNHSQKNNLIQNSEGNEKNRYPVPDPNKTNITDTKEHSNAHKNSFKEEILQVITENFREKIQDMVNQNVQNALKKFQDTKVKNMRPHRKKKKLRGALNKHQSETENTINREINELKLKIKILKRK
jgi:hypothetical protein